jgi:hypothetical protein
LKSKVDPLLLVLAGARTVEHKEKGGDTDMQQLLFKEGHIHGYDVIMDGDRIIVLQDGKIISARKIDGFAKFTQNAKELKIGWGQFEHDGDEVIYIYDKADDGFGYALNLDDHQCSEWGYAPFAQAA